jgi:hypothetical protein
MAMSIEEYKMAQTNPTGREQLVAAQERNIRDMDFEQTLGNIKNPDPYSTPAPAVKAIDTKELEQKIVDIKKQLEVLRKERKDLDSAEPTFATSEEKDAFEEAQLRAGAEAYMEYDPDKAISWLEKADIVASRKKQSTAARVSLFNQIAADFANLEPDDQAGWDKKKQDWVEYDPDSEQFIPNEANQNNWDRIQSQGRRFSNVAPKGDYAAINKLESQSSNYAILAQRASGLGDEITANAMNAKAIETQKQADELKGKAGKIEGPTSTEILNEFKDALTEVLGKATKDFIPSQEVNALKAQITQKYGTIPSVDIAFKDIDKAVSDKQAGKRSGYEDYSSEEKIRFDSMDNLYKLISIIGSKLKAVISLNKGGVKLGALANAAKSIQQDVLANDEFKRYSQGAEGQFLQDVIQNIKKGLTGVDQTPSEANINAVFTALFDMYNDTRNKYINAMTVTKNGKTSTNMYAGPAIASMPVQTYAGLQTGAEGGTGGTGGKVIPQDIKNKAQDKELPLDDKYFTNDNASKSWFWTDGPRKVYLGK